MSEQTVTPPSTLPPFPFPTAPSRDDVPDLARLRAEEPLVRVRLASGHEAWLVTRYEDCRTVMSDARFSRALFELRHQVGRGNQHDAALGHGVKYTIRFRHCRVARWQICRTVK